MTFASQTLPALQTKARLKTYPIALLALLAQSLALPSQAWSEDAKPEPPSPLWLEQHIITGSSEITRNIAGSATYLDAEALQIQGDSDVSRILRHVPGVNLQEEDGFGLRPNIGLRGTGLDRSSKITLMEDGVLIAPAPYAAPSAYYFPNIARMHAIEVVKGPASVLYGPRTQGGAINLISTPVPQTASTRLSVQGGEFGAGRALARAGGRKAFDGFVLGGLAEILYDRSNGFKQLDGGGNTGFEIRDYLVKLLASAPDNAAVKWETEFKAQAGGQVSNETYLGLSAEDFAANPYRRYAASAMDQFNSDHTELSGRFSIQSGIWQTSLIAYRTDFARDWRKLEKLGEDKTSSILSDPDTYANAYNILTGTADTDDTSGTLEVRHNNRSYYAHGVQWVGSADFATGPLQHDVQIGFRWHEDHIDRFQWWDHYDMTNGHMVIAGTDEPGTESNRVGEAESFALFVTDTLEWGRLSLTPGLRYEHINTGETRYADDDPTRQAEPDRIRNNSIDVVMPGIGLYYDLEDYVSGLSVLFGIHRGLNPPGPGAKEDTRPEDAINYEFGLRWQSERLILNQTWQFSLIGYVNDYNNLLGTCTVSGGGNCTDNDIADSAQFNGDAALIGGLEMELGGMWESPNNGLSVPWALTYTFTHARFESSFESDFWGNVEAGYAVPYIPEHQLTLSSGIAGLGIKDTQDWSLDASLNWVSQTRSEAGSGAIPEDERIDNRVVFDLTARYEVFEGVSVYIRAKNLFDAVYIAARRPAGLRPGLPQQFLAGLDISF